MVHSRAEFLTDIPPQPLALRSFSPSRPPRADVLALANRSTPPAAQRPISVKGPQGRVPSRQSGQRASCATQRGGEVRWRRARRFRRAVRWLLALSVGSARYSVPCRRAGATLGCWASGNRVLGCREPQDKMALAGRLGAASRGSP